MIRIRSTVIFSIGLGFVLLFCPRAEAQVAERFLTAFENLCLPKKSYEEVVAGFKSRGWKSAESDLDPLYAQDLSKPDLQSKFVFEEPNGEKVLGASLSEERGLFFSRNRTICMVRIFVESPLRVRNDFSKLIGSPSKETVDREGYLADAWVSYIRGKVIGFRAVRSSQGHWVVTAYRIFTDG